MFCPSCEGEYRPGITRCPTCDVDLAEQLARPPEPRATAEIATVVEGMADYCGFLTLDEARAARDALRGARVPAEILVRDRSNGGPAAPVEEEYWLRVPSDSFARVTQVLGTEPEADIPVEEEEENGEGDASFGCSECGETVAAEETFCPHCGARFDE